MMSNKDQPPLPMNRASPLTGTLIDLLLPHATVHVYPAGQKLPLRVDDISTCYILLEGTTEFHRGMDGLVVTRIYPPAIAGLANVQFSAFRDSWIETRELCRIATLGMEQAYDIIRQNDQMETLLTHINSLLGKLYYYNLLNTASSAYEIIRYQLLELMTESDEFRASTTVEKYIRSKTHLSRSGILKILAELKTGSFVEMNEGRLVKINKLPAKY